MSDWMIGWRIEGWSMRQSGSSGSTGGHDDPTKERVGPFPFST